VRGVNRIALHQSALHPLDPVAVVDVARRAGLDSVGLRVAAAAGVEQWWSRGIGSPMLGALVDALLGARVTVLDVGRVPLGPELDVRRGLLGKGSFLAVTWTQNFRSSPVKRGAWVLENILGTPPPEPPPNVPALEETKSDDGKALTLREQMTRHRSNPTCAGCHKIMDPIGFALENFDADASWRTTQGGDGGVPIDAKVKLYDGQEVDGPAGLRTALLRYSPQFVRMFIEKTMTFALGRGLEYTDMPTVRAIVCDAAKDDNKFSAIVLGVIRSAQFQMRAKAADVAPNTP